jgi:hypothetical protein
MQAGDVVQVQQQDRGIHWLYAIVITANADGSAFVQIRHPGNKEHGAMLFYGKGQIRTGADVQKLIDAMPAQAIGAARLEKQSLQVQREYLT